jgi:hypothetical protein
MGFRMKKTWATGSRSLEGACGGRPDGMAAEGAIDRIDCAGRSCASQPPEGRRILLFWGVTRTVS